MSFAGEVLNGGIVLDTPVPLPNGTKVRIDTDAVSPPAVPAKRSLLERLGDVVGKVEGLPADAALNLNRYLYWQQKR